MRNFYLIIGFLLMYNLGYSQQNDCACSAEREYDAQLQEGLISFEYRIRVNDDEGLQYFNNWAPGEVMLNNGDIMQNLYLRYNKFLDELLYLRQSDFRVGILKKDAITGFRILNDVNQLSSLFVKKKVLLAKADSTEVYLHLLASGLLNLYAYRNVSITNSRYTLGDNTKYLIVVSGGQHFVTLKRKSLLEIPLVLKNDMKTILRANRITPDNNEREFIRAISIYNATHQQQ
jgi:hypothetical protein